MGVPPYVLLAGLASALNFAGLLMFRPLVPIALTAMGVSHGLVGAIVGGFALIPLFLAIPMGGLVDRFGARPFILFGSVFLSASMIVVVVWPTVLSYALSQIVAGTAQLAIIVSTQTLTSRVPDRSIRERSLGIYTTFVSAGQLVGPLPGGALADARGYSAAFLLGALICLLPILTIPGLPRQGESLDDRSVGQGHRERRVASVPLSHLLALPGVRLAMLSSFGLIFALGVRQTFFAIYVKDTLGYSATFFTVLLSLRALASIAVRLGMTSLIHLARSRHLLLVIGMAIAALSLVVTPWTRTPFTLIAISLGLGLATGVIQPLSMMAVADSTADESRGRAMGLRLTGNRTAQFVSPVLFGAVVGSLGLSGGFIFGGILLVIATALVIPQRRAYAD